MFCFACFPWCRGGWDFLKLSAMPGGSNFMKNSVMLGGWSRFFGKFNWYRGRRDFMKISVMPRWWWFHENFVMLGWSWLHETFLLERFSVSDEFELQKSVTVCNRWRKPSSVSGSGVKNSQWKKGEEGTGSSLPSPLTFFFFTRCSFCCLRRNSGLSTTTVYGAWPHFILESWACALKSN